VARPINASIVIAFLGTKLARSAEDVKVLQSLAPSEFVREEILKHYVAGRTRK
jgi:hypothetical protein